MAVDNVPVITGGADRMGLACARARADRGHLLLVDLLGRPEDIRVDGGLVGAGKHLLEVVR